jgi:hypothetical protein
MLIIGILAGVSSSSIFKDHLSFIGKIYLVKITPSSKTLKAVRVVENRRDVITHSTYI